MNTLSSLLAKRFWYVPDISVWGISDWVEVELLLLEKVESGHCLLFDRLLTQRQEQVIAFGGLIDFRGNHLPEELANPRVFIKSKTKDAAFVVGSETNKQFVVARSAELSEPLLVDLFVVEMGE